MDILKEKNKCYGCGTCSYVCKNKAIYMSVDEEGFYYPNLTIDLCNECGLCVTVCPSNNTLSKVDDYSIYLLKAHDSKLLLKSSSGGAFSLIANAVLEQDGLVCGATFNEKFEVIHQINDHIDGMRKSKYVQSNLHVSFDRIYEALLEGKNILFSGTPCQCHAVKLLMKEFKDQLILVSIVCRGVSSIKFWKEYLDFIEKTNGKIRTIDFRDKTKSQNGRTVTYKTVDERELSISIQEDPFMCIYNKTLSLRPSCYNCPYTDVHNEFDFTIGDAWNHVGELMVNDDGKGTSLVIARSEKAKRILDDIRDVAAIKEIDRDINLQNALKEPAKMTILRKLFFKDITTNVPIELIIKKYGIGVKK